MAIKPTACIAKSNSGYSTKAALLKWATPMIYESHPWKLELERHLRSFKTWSSKAETERGGFYIERGVFLSSFIVRKLMENRKISDAVRDRSIKLEAFPAIRPLSGVVARFYGPSADMHKDYDMTKPQSVTMSSYDLMSEIMHSYVFIPIIERGRWKSFFVNSYHRRDQRLLLIGTKPFENVLTAVIDDDVDSVHIFHHPTSNKVLAEVRASKQRRR